MKKFLVSELKPGISFTKSIYLDKDTVFASPGTTITSADIDKLKQFGVTEILTNGEMTFAAPTQHVAEITDSNDEVIISGDIPDDQLLFKEIFDSLNKQKTEFNTLYEETLHLVQFVYTQIIEDKNVEITRVRELIEKLVDHIKQNPHFSYLLLSMPVSGYYLYNQVSFALLYSILIGYFLEYTRPKLIDLGIASFFADVGMTKVPSSISEKTVPLTDEEFKVFIKHPLVGYQILTQRIKLKNTLAIVALQHHENFNGTGYPQKISGKNIEEFSRIYTIADNFSALINNRPWRKKSLPYEVMKNMISTDVNKFDLNIIKVFLAKLSMYPVGSSAELSDGRKGIVIYSNTEKPLRPVLRILQNSSNQKISKLQFVNLEKETHLFITKAIDSHTFN